jgi:protein-tyrosine phosphatase
MKDDIYWVPGPWPGRLGIASRPRGGDWLNDEVRSWREAGVDVVVSLLTPDEEKDLGLEDEEQVVRAEGLGFHRLPIPDRGVPSSRSELAGVLPTVAAALQGGENVTIHCRQGIGRSSLVAASLLVDAGVTPDQAFQNIAEVRGVPVPETPEQRDWVARLAGELAVARR